MDNKALLNIGIKLHTKFKEIENGNFKSPKCFIGFDGFTDEIISVVDRALDAESRSYLQDIKSFGTRILEASGKSCNFELVTKQTKIGGNAPILTNALLEGGHKIVFAGTIGSPPEIEHLFHKMSGRCAQVYSLASSAKTNALEFKDGKIILGKLDSLKEITYENLLSQVNELELIQILDKTDLLVSANWTMIPHMTDIWRQLLNRIVPKFSKQTTARFMFVDLADPSKRTNEDLREALNILSKLNSSYAVILGVNVSEAEIICRLLEIKYPNTFIDIKESAAELFQKLGITRLIIHHATFALSQDIDDLIYFDSFYTKEPILTTGAGDNFNAGYCNALLYELDKEEMLIAALATSGFYVRNGKSPTMEELSNFLQTVAVP